MFLSTKNEIWKGLKKIYSKAKDATKIYDVNEKILVAKYGNKTTT